MHGCSGACVVALGGVHGCSREACMVALGGVWLLLGGMHGGSGGACMVAPGGCTWLLLGGGHAWDMMRYGDTINEWAVRILLECILVYFNFRKRSFEMSLQFRTTCIGFGPFMNKKGNLKT